MMHGRNNGKKLLTVRIVKHSFEISVLEMHGGVVNESEADRIIFHQLIRLDFELLTLLHVNSVELKLKPNYQKEIGYGQLYGCCQRIYHMVSGRHLVKLILWNHVAMSV